MSKNIQEYFKPAKIHFAIPHAPVVKENVYLNSLKRKSSDLNDLKSTSIDRPPKKILHVVENVSADENCSIVLVNKCAPMKMISNDSFMKR